MSNVQEHFSESFFIPIIKGLVKNEIEIKRIDISSVVPPGENFICELLRFVINFSKKNRTNVQSLSLIGKQLLDRDRLIKFEKQADSFSTELSVFSVILPILEKLEHTMKVSAKLYYTSKEPKKLLLMEDLSASNYKLANRLEGLNLEHCLLAVEKLAYFHAASLLMYEKNPEKIDQFDKGLFSNIKIIERYLLLMFSETRNACKREPSLQKYFVKIKEDHIEKFYTVTNRDPKFNVLNHGDFWCNNLMFQYNEDGKPQDVLFIDFQFSVFTSPLFDLHYFIATSTSLEVKQNHIQTILNHYYDLLSKYVKMLKVNTSIPSRTDFDKDFRDKAFLGFASMCFSLALFKANKGNDASLTNFLENGQEGSFRHSCFTNTDYITSIQWLLPFYDSLGVFD